MRCEAILLALLLGQPPVSGPASATAALSVSVGSHGRVSFTSLTLVFPNANPDQVPVVPAAPAAIAVAARARTPPNAQVTLTVQTADDLRSGTATLPASLIAWEATGPGFVPGTLSRDEASLVATWTGSGVHAGSQQYGFQNSWSHPPGTYSVTIVYTMSMP